LTDRVTEDTAARFLAARGGGDTLRCTAIETAALGDWIMWSGTEWQAIEGRFTVAAAVSHFVVQLRCECADRRAHVCKCGAADMVPGVRRLVTASLMAGPKERVGSRTPPTPRTLLAAA
jgi:hypothetical protein